MLHHTNSAWICKGITAHPLSTAHPVSTYSCANSNIERSVKKNVFWQENVLRDSPSFLKMGQVYTVRAASSLKSYATVSYAVNLVLLENLKNVLHSCHQSQPYLVCPATLGTFWDKCWCWRYEWFNWSVRYPSIFNFAVFWKAQNHEQQRC